MNVRFLPYASTPRRLIAQLIADIAVLGWVSGWVLIGVAINTMVSSVAGVGRQVDTGAHGLADNLESAGHSARHIPLVGAAVSKPLTAASQAALDVAGAGHNLDTTASWLAALLAMAVAAPPVLAVIAPWLVLRLRFVRRKWTVTSVAATPAGDQLLALRALANRPVRQLTEVTSDPVGAWRREDLSIIRRLAALELRSAGARWDSV
ncbi:hypothetical protein [Mycobacterium botniense]|jgi:hypothetical protein|uniref:Transmembrane protein n=1 Tax=Mycobacterium botniense TaxID=84962 RepID=A0A7I9XX47_9MYCO|nr:hypothetical protein [Mycobacterium botniense]GFG74369.1 hypothetical protein MBOT_17340 [Mycobacterium botniense]